MSVEDQAHSDMQFVREVVESSKAFPTSSPLVLYLWSVIVFVGFAMMDAGMSWFWPVGGIVGGFLSMWLNRRAENDRGQIDKARSRRINLHWALGLAGGLVLSIPMQMTGAISEATNGQLALLIIAICYFLAGVHLDRFMIWLGGAAVIAYGLTFFLSAYIWTVPGVIIAGSLAAAGLRLQLAK